MPFREVDLRNVFFSPDGFAIRASWGSNDVRGILDEEEQVQTDNTGNGVMVTATVLRVPTSDVSTGGAWDGLSREQVISIDAKRYRVRDIRKEGDGALSVLTLAAV